MERLQAIRWQERATRGLTPDWCLEGWRHFVVRLQGLRWQGPGYALPYLFRPDLDPVDPDGWYVGGV